jgi:two-component system cell cycle sensor histidine kinase/response regulator CckA
MFVMVVLVVSVLLQLCAAYLALRLIPITRHSKVWAVVAVAISLMALRRGISAYSLVTGDPSRPLDLVVELVALASSVLMLIGMAAIKPLFQSMKNSEEVVRQSEERYRNLYEAAPCGFLSIDREGYIRQCNRRTEQILGYAHGALLGIPMAGLLLDSNGEKGRPAVAHDHLWDGVPLTDMEVQMCTADARAIWVSLSIQPTADAKDSVVEFRAIIVDITERVKATDDLRMTQFAVDHAADSIFLVDQNARFTYVNEAVCKSLQYTREELLTMTVFDINPEFPEEQWPEHWNEIRSGHPVILESVNRTKRGSTISVEICANLLVTGGRELNCAVVRDISERKWAEEQIVILKHSLDAHRDGVYWMDTDNNFVYVNDAGCKVLGYEAQELIGKSILDVNPGASREAMNQVWEILRTDGSFLGETVHRHRNGREFPVEIMTTYVRHGGKEYATGFARDITERKRTEEQLLKAKRLEAAGQLAGQIAHDFNNLLGPLIAYPEMIAKHLGSDTRTCEMLHDMEEAAKQIAEINQELLTMSRRGHYNLEPVDLNRLVEHSLRTLPVPARITVRRELSDRLPLVRGGPSQVMRILANLITNAADAMPDGGTLTLRSEPRHLKEPLKRYPDVKPGDFVRLDIADTGRGIPAAVAGHIFEPFFTTKKADKKRGSGLGLTVVHSVMEDHNGFVEFESTPGTGTTFSLFFPVTLGNVAAPGPRADVPKGNGESVLVADDDSLQLRIAERTLRQLGYIVHTVSSGEEAVAFLADHKQDIVLLDMVMDGIDGTETLRRIKKKNPDQIAIILSGFACSERVDEALRLGARGFIQKPVKLAELAAALHDVLSGHRAAAPVPVA